jgi:hypothetical protein
MLRKRDFLPLLYGPRLDSGSVWTKVDLRMLAFFSIMLALIGLAGWLYLRQASEVAGYAHEIRELEREKERLHREITALRAEVALRSSLQRVYAEAEKLGYHVPEASDSSRRVTVVSQPQQEPSVGSPATGQEPPPGSDALLGSRQGSMLQRLLAQLKVWLDGPPNDDHAR